MVMIGTGLHIGMGAATGGGAFVGALDNISNIVVAADLRRLLTSYTGDLVLLRRVSDDAELAFGYDGSGNLDTAAISTWIGGSSARVKTLYDQSGNGNNLTQATNAQQPLLVLGATGSSRPTIQFERGAYSLATAAFTALSQPNTVLCGFRTLDSDIAYSSLFDGIAVGNRHYLAFNQAGNLAYLVAGATVNDDLPWGTVAFKLATVEYNGASTKLYRNGTQIYTGNAGAHTLTGAIIGTRYDGSATNDIRGEICSYVLIDGALSVTEHASYVANHRNYYGYDIAPSTTGALSFTKNAGNPVLT